MIIKANHSLLLVLLWQFTLPTIAQVSSENYVQTTQRISDTESMTTTLYYDGLGRPYEKVEHGITPSGDNLLWLQQYDGIGREWKTWLPVISSSEYASISTITSMGNSQYMDSHAFSANNYEDNPLNRITSVEGVGEEWVSHPVKTEHLINGNHYPLNSKYYRVSMQGQLQEKGYYPEGRLYVTKTTDEDGHESYEFSNKAGRVVLKRKIVSLEESADTYFIYDYRGNLSFVLSPNYQDDSSLDLYAYQYKYDGRGNCIWKKLPGCEPVYMKYDLDNRLVFLQDGNLRKQGLWVFCFYDKLGRQAVKGTTGSPSDVDKTHVYVSYTGSGTLDGYQLIGTSITPRSLLETDFYDDYAFLEKYSGAYKNNLALNTANAFETAFPSNAAPNAKGYLTGKKVYLTDGSNRNVVSSMYYGKQGRVVQTHTSNLLGGFDDVYSAYTYIGSPLKTKHIHEGKRTLQESYEYAYDRAGRPTTVGYTIAGSSKRVLSSTEYDDYGRIRKQNILGKETVNNTYNIRSWKTGISSPNFTQKLAYNKSNGMLSPSAATYSGNISAMGWISGGNSEKGYKFTYNRQGMLTDAEYGEGESLSNNQGRYDESLSYDKMGNVLSLMRYGLRDDNQYGLIDNLSYGYNGNQLIKVDDTVAGPYYAGAFHFVDGAKSSVEYTYDANGNLVQDQNKGISSISYDVNNLPRQIKYSDGRMATYTYDAAGNKLFVDYNLTSMTSALPQMPVMQTANVISANTANGQKAISYCGNVIYDGDETIVLNDVGYSLYDKEGSLSFHYYLKDHLGDNRVVMNENGTVEQVNDYYPTGALMESSKNGEVQRYKYNGKELDRLNGLDWYDYGARFYDATIGRWNGMDDLCEKYLPFTPYGYCMDNFMNAYDIDGRKIIPTLFSYKKERNAIGQLYRSKTNFVKAMTAFGKTTYGRDFIGSFLQKGEFHYGVKGNGKCFDANLEIKEFDLANNGDYMGNNYGAFSVEEKEGRLNFVLKIDCLGKSVAELLETILHEFTLHGYDFGKIYDIYKAQGFDAAYRCFNKSSSETEHKDLKIEKSQKGGAKYKKARKEILNNNPEYKKVFDDRNKSIVE